MKKYRIRLAINQRIRPDPDPHPCLYVCIFIYINSSGEGTFARVWIKWYSGIILTKMSIMAEGGFHPGAAASLDADKSELIYHSHSLLATPMHTYEYYQGPRIRFISCIRSGLNHSTASVLRANDPFYKLKLYKRPAYINCTYITILLS